MIIFNGVGKKYGSKTVLQDINLEIKPKEFVSIMGASGAGKSTLIHLLIGAKKPDKGFVQVDDLVINELDSETLQIYRRKIGVVFQDYKLLPKKTIFENISFAMEVCNADEEEINERVPQVLRIVGLSGSEQYFPHELSGGEQQRVAIARALVHNPKLILADEPTGNLDPVNTKEIMDLLTKINSHGVTVILASHDVATIDELKTRVVMLVGGRII